MDLSVAKIVERTEAAGPGMRFALWTQGCPIRCPGCCNPEMFGAGGAQMSTRELAVRIAATPKIEGLSLLGGEPFAQAEACAQLARAARVSGLSVVVFSGYTLEELRTDPSPHVEALLAWTDVLFAGPFVAAQPETERRWIGSANQQIHLFTDRYHPDDPRFRQRNTVEVRLRGREILVNGWPRAADALRARPIRWRRP